MKWTRAYKGFDENLQCRGFQYEIGKEYTHKGDVKVCDSGFHACPMPLDVFRHYAPSESRYCVVEQSGIISKEFCEGRVEKCASEKIRIVREITAQEMVEEQYRIVKAKQSVENDKIATAGNYSAAIVGLYGMATAGVQGVATSGDYGIATAGTYGAAAAGCYGVATVRDRGVAIVENCGVATVGDYGVAIVRDFGLATAGYRGVATVDAYGVATSRGKSTAGENGMACARGNDVKVRGGLGALLVIAKENGWNGKIKHWKAFVVDGINIKPNTWYGLNSAGEIEAYDET